MTRLRRFYLVSLGTLLLNWTALPAASAQPAPSNPPAAAAPAVRPAPPTAAPAPSAGADQDGYVLEQRPAAMTSVEAGLPAPPLVAAAYSFIWLAILAFVVHTLRRTAQLKQDLQQLEERLRQPDAGRSTH